MACPDINDEILPVNITSHLLLAQRLETLDEKTKRIKRENLEWDILKTFFVLFPLSILAATLDWTVPGLLWINFAVLILYTATILVFLVAIRRQLEQKSYPDLELLTTIRKILDLWLEYARVFRGERYIDHPKMWEFRQTIEKVNTGYETHVGHAGYCRAKNAAELLLTDLNDYKSDIDEIEASRCEEIRGRFDRKRLEQSLSHRERLLARLRQANPAERS